MINLHDISQPKRERHLFPVWYVIPMAPVSPSQGINNPNVWRVTSIRGNQEKTRGWSLHINKFHSLSGTHRLFYYPINQFPFCSALYHYSTYTLYSLEMRKSASSIFKVCACIYAVPSSSDSKQATKY